MQDAITPITDDRTAQALKYMFERECLTDIGRRGAVLAHRRHSVAEAERMVSEIASAIAAAEIALTQLKSAKERAVDVLVDKREDLKRAVEDEAKFAEAS
jgi:hypothetical protein